MIVLEMFENLIVVLLLNIIERSLLEPLEIYSCGGKLFFNFSDVKFPVDFVHKNQ